MYNLIIKQIKNDVSPLQQYNLIGIITCNEFNLPAIDVRETTRLKKTIKTIKLTW